MTIYYATEQQWSSKRRKTICEEAGGKTIEQCMIRGAGIVFVKPIRVARQQINNRKPFRAVRTCPSKPHGLNSYADIDNIVFLSSLNPPTDHFRFLESRGLLGSEVRAFTYCAAAYQSIMRTSIREPKNGQPKRILVPDLPCLILRNIFPGSRVEKLDIGLSEDKATKRGRPRQCNFQPGKGGSTTSKGTGTANYGFLPSNLV